MYSTTPTKASHPSPSARKSPLRQSLRNLLSVFKKANVHEKEETSPADTGRSKSYDSPNTHDPYSLPSPKELPTSVLYLSRLHSASPPVWIACTATLNQGVIDLSLPAPDGDIASHRIDLSHCTDVRSLDLAQVLALDEGPSLPDTPEGRHFNVFQILFEGRARETFAASSFRERVSWINAIWYVNSLCTCHSVI